LAGTIACLPQQAKATGAATLYTKRITPMVVGSTLTLQIRIDTGASYVNSVEADFTYPTSVLSFTSIDGSTSGFNIDASSTGGSGSVSIIRGSTVPGGVTGDLLIANVNFNVLTTGTANIAFQNSSVALDNTTNLDDLSTKTNGQYTTVNPVYRFYIKQTYEHFWTTDLNERNSMIAAGYQYEGVAWYSSTDTSMKPVYRLYAAGIRQHLLTIDANEKSVLSSSGGWSYEGINEYVNLTSNSYPVYRLYAPSLGVHLLTTDSNERNVLVAGGSWQSEGVGWYQPN
jgi:hypothetical protein